MEKSSYDWKDFTLIDKKQDFVKIIKKDQQYITNIQFSPYHFEV